MKSSLVRGEIMNDGSLLNWRFGDAIGESPILGLLGRSIEHTTDYMLLLLSKSYSMFIPLFFILRCGLLVLDNSLDCNLVCI